jgi:hypothetical protein
MLGEFLDAAAADEIAGIIADGVALYLGLDPDGARKREQQRRAELGRIADECRAFLALLDGRASDPRVDGVLEDGIGPARAGVARLLGEAERYLGIKPREGLPPDELWIRLRDSVAVALVRHGYRLTTARAGSLETAFVAARRAGTTLADFKHKPRLGRTGAHLHRALTCASELAGRTTLVSNRDLEAVARLSPPTSPKLRKR